MLRLLAPAAIAFLVSSPALAGPRVVSLDQCADQYVLALAPREAIAGVSMRADDADSYLRGVAQGLPRRRVTLEAVLAARPQAVVRYWGGGPAMMRALERRGVRVITIEDASDFDGVRANVRRVAAALGGAERGEALIARMDMQLARSRGAWGGRRALYLTSGGYTSGPDTLIDAIMRAAGLTNQASDPGFGAAPLESMVLNPPAAVVKGFFSRVSLVLQRWGPGRHRVLRRVTEDRTITELPASILGCPAWFAADAAAQLAAARR